MENHNSNDSKDPASFLSSIIGVPVTVKLNSGIVYKGELQSVDGYMNIALEKCQEYVNGQARRNYGDAFVRGNNGKGILSWSLCYKRWRHLEKGSTCETSWMS
jgi:U6 snRNA-associated Sm-like protein LSm6